jgi:hypothetical protein
MNACNERLHPHPTARVALLMLALMAQSVAAESIYKCRDAKGHIAYQDHACPPAQQQSEIQLDPAPAPAPSPDYGVAAKPRGGGHVAAKHASPPHAAKAARETLSYECRAADGEVFYRHSGCPKSIPAAGGASQGASPRGARGHAKDKASVSVSAHPLPRSQVCRVLAKPSARAGHERDETVSTYERNAGRDPCRWE